MLHQNPTARRRSGGFKSFRRQAGIALAQLAIAIGLGALLVAAAVTTGLDLFQGNQLNSARDELTATVVGLSGARMRNTRAELDTASTTAADFNRLLRSAGGRALLGETNAFGSVVIAVGGHHLQYPTPSADDCATLRDELDDAPQVAIGATGVVQADRTAAETRILIVCVTPTGGTAASSLAIQL